MGGKVGSWLMLMKNRNGLACRGVIRRFCSFEPDGIRNDGSANGGH